MMNEAAYEAVIGGKDTAGVCVLPPGFLRVTGRDRASFLQGQVSNDVVGLFAGQTSPACLLNATGHLLANLQVYVLEEAILIGTDQERVAAVTHQLNRYLVRERVEIEEAPQSLITVQGGASARIIERALELEGVGDIPESGILAFQTKFGEVIALPRRRFIALAGYDLIFDSDRLDPFLLSLLSEEGAVEIDADTQHVLRVECGEPAWGAELDESIIPLEAGLDDAISYTKGCYIGQEIIARIHSRGHTNRTLVRLSLERSVDAGAALTAVDGEKSGQEVGRVTSVANSPRFGLIGLGYVRNEYSQAGTNVGTSSGAASIASGPFTDGKS